MEQNAATVTYGILQTAFGASCMNRASVFEWHKRFKEGRESVKDDERCERSKEVNTPELIGLRLGLLCWGFKGVQEEILSEEASTLQIGSVAFPSGQCTCPQLYLCHRLFEQNGHQDRPLDSALQPEEITSKGTRVSCVYYQQKCPYEKSLETYLMILLTPNTKDKRVIALPKDIILKVNVIAWLEFELTYYDVTV